MEQTLNLSNYLYYDEGPKEKLCEMGYYSFKEDWDLKRRIYDNLPAQCKSMIQDI